MTTLYLPKPMDGRRRLEAVKALGKPVGRTPGGWVADLAGLKKSVALCAHCDPKWSPKRHGYYEFRRDVKALDTCDGCQTVEVTKIFVHESVWFQVGQPPRRRTGRWGTMLGWLPERYRTDTR